MEIIKILIKMHILLINLLLNVNKLSILEFWMDMEKLVKRHLIQQKPYYSQLLKMLILKILTYLGNEYKISLLKFKIKWKIIKYMILRKVEQQY